MRILKNGDEGVINMKKIILVFLMGFIVLGYYQITVSALVHTTSSSIIRSASSEYRIEDVGRFQNPMDTVFFSLHSGLSVSDWKTLGYNNVKIFITIEMKEYNPGYQYIYLYRNDYSSETGNLLFDSEIIEFGGGGFATTTWGDYMYETITISLDDFENDRFFIRYDASGMFEDDWGNRYLRIYFQFNS